MATLTIKNIPDDLYQSIKDQAIRHHRSINSEVINSLEQAVQKHNPQAHLMLKKARSLRAKSKSHYLTEKELKTAKEKGRL